MRVIPVIDLIGGQVVRGIAGQRQQYRPIESLLAADAQPATVAKALADLGFREVYIADLDAIGGSEPAWRVYRQIASCGLRLHIDAGLANLEHAQRMLRFANSGVEVAGVIAGLESLVDPEQLGELLSLVTPDKLVFSLDMKNGQSLTDAPAWQGLTALQIARLAIELGARRMILLDLAQVGTNAGVGLAPLCQAVQQLDPNVEIISGGGVRGAHDLELLAAAGCQAALVASALHDGRLTASELAPYMNSRPARLAFL